MLLPMVEDFLPQMDGFIDNYFKSWKEKEPLQPGEDIIVALFVSEGQGHVTISVMDEKNCMKKQIITMPFTQFVITLLEAFKNSKD